MASMLWKLCYSDARLVDVHAASERSSRCGSILK